jgi:NTE family protein
MLTGEEVLLSEGPAVDAILASAAIPGVFPAVEWQGRMLVDGGVLNNTPISHAVELGADHVVVLPAITAEPMATAPRGALGAGVAAVSRAICWRFAQDVARYSGVVDLTVLPSPCTRGILPTDFGCAGQLIGDGRRLARTALRQARPFPARPRRRLSLAQAA